MTTKQFNQDFGTEEQCIEHFKTYRLSNDLTCKKCKSKKFYWISNRRILRCKKCQHDLSIRSGTFMMHSNLSFKKWYEIIYYDIINDGEFSNAKIQRLVNINRYETVWYAINKLRKVMHKINLNLPTDCSTKVVPDSSKRKSNKHYGLPKNAYYNFSAENHLDKRYSISYFRKPFKKKTIKYRCKKVINLPEERDIQPYNSEKYEKISYTMERDIKYILTKIHRTVSDTFVQLYLDEYCFKNANNIEMRFRRLFRNGVNFQF